MRQILLLLLFAVPSFAQVPVPLGKTIDVPDVFLYNPTTGLPAQADSSGPVYCTVHKNASSTPLSVSGAAVVMSGVTTNGAMFSFALTSGNGFAIDDRVNVYCSATVGGVNGTVSRASYLVKGTEVTVGYPAVDVSRFGGTAVTGRDIGASVLLSSGTGTGQLKLAAGYVAPTFSDITGTLDAAEIGTGAITAAKFAANAIDSAALATDAVIEIAAGISFPTAATIANLVWDTTLASHLTAGTTGAALNSASSAGDPWATPVPASYVAGTAGYIVGNQVLRSITNNRPVLVSAAGGVAPDWANILAPTTTVDLSGTTIRLSNGTGTGQVKLSSGYISPNFSDINGTLDAAEFSSAFITNFSFAANAIDSNALGATATAEIAAAITVPTAAAIASEVWDTMDAGHSISGTFGEDLNAAGTAGDPLNTMVPASYAAGTMGYIIGNQLLRSITNNRPVLVSAAGGVAPDWANVQAPTTVLNLSGTTVKNATDTTALLPSALVGGKMDANVSAYTTGFGGFTIRKNVGVANYPFKLFLTGTSNPAPGISAANISCFVSKDGAAGVALSDTTESEIDATNLSGWYTVDLSATELNASVVIFRCKAATTEPFEQIIVPEN